jgi:hypothetical protein
MTINLSHEVEDMLKGVKKDGQSLQEVALQAIKLGCYQLEYRMGDQAKATRKAYQEKKKADDKVARELLKKAQQDPELAVKLGLGTRVAL